MGRLIGLAGRAGAGKSTLASMIREQVPGTVEIAFADPIKRFCREVFAFTENQLTTEEKEVIDPRYGLFPA